MGRNTFFMVAVLPLVAGCGPLTISNPPGEGPPGPSPLSNWPLLGHDLSSTFYNKLETKLSKRNVGRLAPVWETTGLGVVNGAPAVVDGVAYIVSNEGTFAVHIKDGSIIWKVASVGGVSSPTYSNGVLFVNDGPAVVHALDAKDGHELWQTKIDSHPQAIGFSSPTVFGRYVVVGTSSADESTNLTETSTYRGSVVALDRTTGEELWRYYTVDLPFSGATVWSSVSIDPELGLVFATTGNNYTGGDSGSSDAILALSLKDGSLAWLTQLAKNDIFTVYIPTSPDSDFGTNPILFDAKIDGYQRKLVGAGQKSGTFWALDRKTGEVVWSQVVSGGSSLVGGIFNNGAFDGHNLIVAGNLGTSTAPGSEDANGESAGPDLSQFPTPPPGTVISPGAITFTPITSVLKALDPATGNVVWERQLPAWVWAPITTANGVGFVAYETQLQGFDLQTGEKLFNYKTAGTITSAPVPVNGAVYFGSGLSYVSGHPDRTFHALAVDGVRVDGGGVAVADAATDSATDAGADGNGGNAGTPTFSSVYQQVVLDGGCNTASCHGGANAGNLSMTTQAEAYTQLVGVSASGPACGTSGLKRVDPGHPETSLIVNKVSANPPVCGLPMPPTGGLPEAAIAALRAWIQGGAAND